MATTFLVPTNNAVGHLNAAIDDDDLTLTLRSGEGDDFPATYPFHVTIDDEILEVSDNTDNVLTFTREAESTTAAAHLAGAVVSLNITAQAISDLNTAVNTLEPYNVLTTRGDIIYRNATVPARLAKGADNTILAMGANDPEWKTPATILADISPLTTRGDIMFRNATVSTRLAKGAANTVLVMGSDDPAWSATLAGLTLTSPTINGTISTTGLTLPAVTLGGAVSGNAQTISNANVTVGASRTLDVSAGTLTLAADQISGDKVEGGTINAITITTLTSDSVDGVDVSALSATPALAHLLYQFQSRLHRNDLPCIAASDLAAGGGWTAATAGTGGSTAITNNSLNVGVNSDIGSASYFQLANALYVGYQYGGINWAKELFIQFSLLRMTAAAVTNDSDVEGYVQLKATSATGALGADGIGIRIGYGDKTGLALRGEAWDTELETADFDAPLVHRDLVVIGIHLRPGVSVDFYRDGVLQTNKITTQLPITVSGSNYYVVSLQTLTDCVAAIGLSVGDFLVLQAL